ncbi:MAG: hypothetical protein ABIY55_05180 [Kofleriaceae bacterium]
MVPLGVPGRYTLASSPGVLRKNIRSTPACRVDPRGDPKPSLTTGRWPLRIGTGHNHSALALVVAGGEQVGQLAREVMARSAGDAAAWIRALLADVERTQSAHQTTEAEAAGAAMGTQRLPGEHR